MVLEAREGSESIWFPVVWEDIKDASNVIDYNINKEITVNTTALWTANNDTTTWMATMIPWVNEHKLFEKTSIIKQKELYWSISVTESHSGSLPDDWYQLFDNFTTSSESGDVKYLNTAWEWIKIPVNWYYSIYISYPTRWSSFTWDVYIRCKKTLWAPYDNIHKHTVASNWETETITAWLLWGAYVYVSAEAVPMSAIATIYPTISMTITKV